jgi:heme exporter protein CcmD
MPDFSHPDWPYIWPSYGLTFGGLALLVVFVVRELTTARKRSQGDPKGDPAP